MGKYNVFKGEIPGDIEQHLYTLRGIGFPLSKLSYLESLNEKNHEFIQNSFKKQ